MKKELNYLSLPDFFNKMLLINFNQKVESNKIIAFQFKLSNKNHLGSGLKAIYLLEIIFPKKVFVHKIFIKKKKKIYFGQKIRSNVHYYFSLNISIIDFVEFFRFFLKVPINKNKTKFYDENIIINKKLKQFEFNNNLFFSFKTSSSLYFFTNYYLN